MPRRSRHEPINTFLSSRFAGQLRRESSGAISFNYDRSWIEWPQAIPGSLSLPIREKGYTGAMPNDDSRVAHAAGSDPKPSALSVELSVCRASCFLRGQTCRRHQRAEWVRA